LTAPPTLAASRPRASLRWRLASSSASSAFTPAAVTCLSAGGCVLDGAGIRDAAKSAGLGPKEVAAPDFVEKPAADLARVSRGGAETPTGRKSPPPRRDFSTKSGANEARGRDAAKVGGAVKPPAPPKVPPAE
jgi:hypothetical protein